MIDATVPGSPGWWMNRLAGELQFEQRRLRILEDYYTGRPPLAWGSQDVRKQFYRFQQVCRTNFAAVVVEAPCERIAMRSIATGADDSADGDDQAWKMVKANLLQVTLGTAARMAKRFGRSYLATAYPEDPGGYSIITVEDPRQMITAPDPIRPLTQRAAFKLYFDAESELDVAVLWLPGEKWVATREHKSPVRPSRQGMLLGTVEPLRVRFAPSSYTMAPVRGPDDSPEGWWSEAYDDQEIPVDPILNRDGVGEYELHTDLLDRINHMILQRVVIATLQAFKQRAIRQSAAPDVPQLPEFDLAGNRIDYSDILEAGPDAVWLLPPGAELWESGQVDLSGILQSAKDDILHLSAVTKTPLSMFTPDAISQSAEGAALTREGLVFKVEDFQLAAGAALGRAIARGFRYMGDTARGDAAAVEVEWMPADRRSLSEMGSAASQVSGTLTWEQTQSIVWQQTPAQIRLAKVQRAEDAALVKAALPLPAPPAPPAPHPGVGPDPATMPNGQPTPGVMRGRVPAATAPPA